MKDIRLLRPDEIEVRIQSVNKGGARLLLFKNARCDMNILDETFGAMNWQRRHTRDNANCIISVWDEEKKQWISKEDTGTDSDIEPEKGRASSSFKRAASNWGIGRELYTAPDIFVFKSDLKTYTANGDKYRCYDSFEVADITYDGRTIATVTIRNVSTDIVYTFGNKTPTRPTRKDVEPTTPTQTTVSQANIDVLKSAIEKKGFNISLVLGMAGVETLEGITPEEYNKVVKTVRGL